MKYKKYVDESYVFWTSDSNGKTTDEEINIHFNEWYSRNNCFLDIGVRVCKIKRTEKLFIYLPLALNEYDIVDLYNQFDEKWISRQLDELKAQSKQSINSISAKNAVKNISCAIFNSCCEYTIGTDIEVLKKKVSKKVLQNIIKIKHGARIDYFVKLQDICKISNICERGVNGCISGTLLEIDCKNFKDLIVVDTEEDGYEKGFYVRFRVPHSTLQNKNLKNDVATGTLVDAPSSDTLIQYMQRVNELRSLPLKIREEHKGIEKQYIGKVMSMIAAGREYEINDEGCYKIRQLEYNLHKMYLPDKFVKGKKKDNINIYQWNAVNRKPKAKRTSSFIFNIKIRRTKSTVNDKLRYMLVCLFSYVGSIIFTWLFSKMLP